MVSGVGLLGAVERWLVFHETQLLDPRVFSRAASSTPFLSDLSFVCAEHLLGRVVRLPTRQGPTPGAPRAAPCPPERLPGQGPPHTLSCPKASDLSGRGACPWSGAVWGGGR